MRNIIRFILLLITILLAFYIINNQQNQKNNQTMYENIKSELLIWKDNPEVISTINSFRNKFEQIINLIDKTLLSKIEVKNEKRTNTEKPILNKPVSHSFSIYNFELGDSRKEIEKKVGTAQRSTLNDYGVKWSSYHKNYHNFFMIGFDKNDKAVAMYTNQDLLSSKQGIKLGTNRETVLKKLNKPITQIQKGWISYQFENNGEYDIFKLDNSYVTIFYDKHENNTVTAVQVISEELETEKKGIYASSNKALKEGFENQLFDLTNAARVEHGLKPLTWDNIVKQTARDHSSDMAKNHYFSHTNLKGQSPFDRMEEDHISFHVAGENLASGQFSSIFAHEGLMNSIGHRKNILQPEFESIGIGVAFDSKFKPYYTENFLTK